MRQSSVELWVAPESGHPKIAWGRSSGNGASGSGHWGLAAAIRCCRPKNTI